MWAILSVLFSVDIAWQFLWHLSGTNTLNKLTVTDTKWSSHIITVFVWSCDKSLFTGEDGASYRVSLFRFSEMSYRVRSSRILKSANSFSGCLISLNFWNKSHAWCYSTALMSSFYVVLQISQTRLNGPTINGPTSQLWLFISNFNMWSSPFI